MKPVPLRAHGLLAALFLLMAVTAACESSVTAGNGLLPDGMSQAKVPQAELNGFVFLSASPSVAVSTSRSGTSAGITGLPVEVPSQFGVVGATLVAGSSYEEVGGTVTFASPEDADTAWKLFEADKRSEEVWGVLESPRMHVVRGKGSWSTSVRSALESGRLVSLATHDPDAWALVTNLPEKPPSRPIAAGVIKFEQSLLKDVGLEVSMPLPDVTDALDLAGVEAVAFGIYSDTPSEAIEEIDRDFLKQSGSAALVVSHSSYHGALMSLLLRVGAGPAGMEEIDVGDTTARYRKIGDLHLIAKTDGSFIYAAIAGARGDAEKLVLSAIAD